MRTLLFAALLAAPLGALACGPTVTVSLHEIATGRPAVARAPDAVVIYRDAPPPRPFVTQYVMTISPAAPTTLDVLARYRDNAARAGCDAVIVYTEENALIKDGPRSADDSLVLGLDGRLASRAIGVGLPNKRAIFVERPKRLLIVDAPSVGLCISFDGPPSPQ
jgi:hypothetical protein